MLPIPPPFAAILAWTPTLSASFAFSSGHLVRRHSQVLALGQKAHDCFVRRSKDCGALCGRSRVTAPSGIAEMCVALCLTHHKAVGQVKPGLHTRFTETSSKVREVHTNKFRLRAGLMY